MLDRLQHSIQRLFKPHFQQVKSEIRLTQAMLDRNAILQSVAITDNHKSRPEYFRNIHDLEYKVFSQFGEDGIISLLTSYVPDCDRNFIEFGVEDYTESNTRLLLERDNWSGLIMDGSAAHIETVNSRPTAWRNCLRARKAFVTRDNINSLFLENGFSGKVGLLSIDIDGNDYWVWEAITEVEPLVVVCEYNSAFGPDATTSTPYDPNFVRTDKHFSNLYFGASLGALVWLANQRNMRFLGCNRAGNNAFFVHSSLKIDLPVRTAKEGYVKSRFCECRDNVGKLIMKTAHDCLNVIEDLPVVDVRTNATMTLKDSLRLQTPEEIT